MTRFIIAIVVVLGLIQLIPSGKTNPPVEGDFDGPPEIGSILRRACYNCHSHETVWPWYSKVSPVSLMIANNVNEGREHLNFSNWRSMIPEEQVVARKEIWHEIAEGEMPPSGYVMMHKEAKLSETDRKLLREWSTASPKADTSGDGQPQVSFICAAIHASTIWRGSTSQP